MVSDKDKLMLSKISNGTTSPSSFIPSVAVLANAVVEFDSGQIWLIKGNITSSLRLNQCQEKEPFDKVPLSFFKRNIRVSQAVHLAGTWSAAFYHSTVEQIPRLTVLVDWLRQNPNISIIGRKRWGVYLEQVYQISAKRLIEASIVVCETLYVPETIPCGRLSHAIGNEYRRYILDALGAAKDPTSVVVMRRRSSRDIYNHEQLVQEMRQNFANIIEFDEAHLPPPGLHQYGIFRNAKLVIGPHGAGFSNLLASLPETAVIEFHPPNGYNFCFLHLAIQLGMDYHPLPMSASRNATVNITQVLALMKSILM
jgi:hypothetical protein